MSSDLLGVTARAMAMAVVVSLLVLLVGVGGLVFIHVSVIGRVFRRRFRAVAARGCGGGCAGLPPEDLAELPCYDYKAGEVEEEDDAAGCAVCLEGFRGGDRCKLLPVCGHSFHSRCVDPWLLWSSACPICRTSAAPREGRAATLSAREQLEAQ